MTEDKGRAESDEPKKENEQKEQQPGGGNNPLGANFLSQLEDALKGLGGQFVRMDMPRGNMGAQANGGKQPPKKDDHEETLRKIRDFSFKQTAFHSCHLIALRKTTIDLRAPGRPPLTKM